MDNVAAYVTKHLQLKADGKAVALQFVGSEKEEDGTWSYFVVNNVPAVRRIDVVNSLLYDNFPTKRSILCMYRWEERKEPAARITPM